MAALAKKNMQFWQIFSGFPVIFMTDFNITILAELKTHKISIRLTVSCIDIGSIGDNLWKAIP